LPQAAKFNHGNGKQTRKWIQEAAEPQEAMEIAKREEQNPSFRTPGFFDKNKEIMFHIALAKFQQNPKLRRWLLETDRSRLDSPIFHTDSNDFWGLGPQQEDGHYRGKNWNGKILMLVRRKLRRDFGDSSGRTDTVDLTAPPAARLPRDPFPPLGPPEDDEEQGAAMRRSFKYLRASMRSFKLAPLSKGALIAQRYRVLRHVITGLDAASAVIDPRDRNRIDCPMIHLCSMHCRNEGTALTNAYHRTEGTAQTDRARNRGSRKR
jgi:ribA/ribD-fused uncharacterized protein